MQTITSVSGGPTSAYLAANYPADHLLFSLVRIEDERCRFPDEKIRREVEDRIQAPFIATAEDDMIIYTMLDLEQYLGQKINWVTGCTYDHLIHKIKGGYLPNQAQRGCTTYLKLIPMCQWWLVNIGEPVISQIGFRANETHRANNSLANTNAQGLSELKIDVSAKQDKNGKWIKQNKVFAWQRPSFPLIEDGIFKPTITNYWRGKPIRYGDYNNCVGCHTRMPLFLAKMFDAHPRKMDWFTDQENGPKKGTWKKGMRYEDLKKWKVQQRLSFEDLPGCASGYCEVN